MILSRKDRITPYVFIFPSILAMVLFRLYPIFFSFLESFQTTSYGAVPVKKWVGFENYAFIFSDPVFLRAFKTTGIFTLIVNPLQIAWAFGLALLVNRPGKGINFFRTLFFMPITISVAITSVIWGIMLSPNNGLVNALFRLVLIPSQPFLTSENQALLSIIFLASWRAVGYWMIFLLAGLQNIPIALYESAWMDGARPWKTFTRITMPMMKRSFLFVLVADTTANFLMFIPMYTLTRGGPNNSTNTIMYEAFKNVFIYGDRGAGNAMVMVMLAIILIVVALQFFFLRSKD